MTKLNSKVPTGPLKDKWTNYKNNINLVNPANKRLIDVIVVGTGLAGGAAAASRKYDVSQLTIGNWLKEAGSPSPKRKKSNVDIEKTLKRLGELHKEMAKTEQALDKLRKEYADLRAKL